MFFIFGISNGEKKLDFVQSKLCSRCGQFGRLELYMTYMYFSLFLYRFSDGAGSISLKVPAAAWFMRLTGN